MQKPKCPFKTMFKQSSYQSQTKKSLPWSIRQYMVCPLLITFPSVILLTPLLSFWPLLFTEKSFLHLSQSIWTCYVIGHSPPDTRVVFSNFMQISMQMHPVQRDFPCPLPTLSRVALSILLHCLIHLLCLPVFHQLPANYIYDVCDL